MNALNISCGKCSLLGYIYPLTLIVLHHYTNLLKMYEFFEVLEYKLLSFLLRGNPPKFLIVGVEVTSCCHWQ